MTASQKNFPSNLAKLLKEELTEQTAKKEGFVKSSWIKSTRPEQSTSSLFKLAPEKSGDVTKEEGNSNLEHFSVLGN